VFHGLDKRERQAVLVFQYGRIYLICKVKFKVIKIIIQFLEREVPYNWIPIFLDERLGFNDK
jgi:hypothetical protein